MSLDRTGVYIIANDNCRIIGSFKNGVPHGYCKRVEHKIGNSKAVVKATYAFYNAGLFNGNVIELDKSLIDKGQAAK